MTSAPVAENAVRPPGGTPGRPPRGMPRIARPPRRAPSRRARLEAPSAPAGRVLHALRAAGTAARDRLAEYTGVSGPTVNRQIAALIDAGAVRERADLAPAGRTGRPRRPVEIDPTTHRFLGVHVGVRAVTVAVHDLAGSTVAAGRMPTPTAGADASPGAITAGVGRFVRRTGVRPVRVGVAIGGRVHSDGSVDHPRLGWDRVPVGPLLAAALTAPVDVAPHVAAMAAAESAALGGGPHHTGDIPRGTTLVVYARETIGSALVVGGSVVQPTAGPTGLGHLPAGPTRLLDPLGTGHLEGAVADTAVVDAAVAAGLSVRDIGGLRRAAIAGDAVALALLDERAEILGRAVGLVVDIVNPDRVVLAGQAFTAHPQGVRNVAALVAARDVGADREVRVSRVGDRVQRVAAATAALDAAYRDPLGVLACR